MAKSQWSVDNFVSEVASRGLARPYRFEVNIDVPACINSTQLGTYGQVASMFCDAAQLPQTRMLNARQQIFGPPSYHPVGVDYGGDNITLQFYVDRTMNVKRFFDTWADGIVDRTSFTANYQRNYLTNITLSQLDEQDEVQYQVRLIDAFPSSVNPLTLDSNASGQVHKLSVTFVYRRWVSEETNSVEQPEVTRTQNGTAGVGRGVGTGRTPIRDRNSIIGSNRNTLDVIQRGARTESFFLVR